MNVKKKIYELENKVEYIKEDLLRAEQFIDKLKEKKRKRKDFWMNTMRITLVVSLALLTVFEIIKSIFY